jgi:hypothetical protein
VSPDLFYVRRHQAPLILASLPFIPQMRYSRLLEENSYANRRADFLWLLIVCSAMLLVRPSLPQACRPRYPLLVQPQICLTVTHSVPPTTAITVHLPSLHRPLPLRLPRLRARLHLVPPEPVRADVPHGRHHPSSTLPPDRVGRRQLGDVQ